MYVPHLTTTLTIVRVVVATSYPLLYAGLQVALDSFADIAFVGVVPIGDDVLHTVQCTAPDLVLVDTALQGPPIEAVVQALHDQPLPVKIIMLVDPQTVPHVRIGAGTGVAGYVLKTEPLEQVAMAVRVVAQGAGWISPAFMAQMATAPSARPERGLTKREQSVAALLPLGLTALQIGQRLGITDRAVRGHLDSIRTKLGVKFRSEIITWVHAMGLTPLADADESADSCSTSVPIIPRSSPWETSS